MDWTDAIQNKRLFVVDYDLKHEEPIQTLHLTLDGAKKQAQRFIEDRDQLGEWTLIVDGTSRGGTLVLEHECGRDCITIGDALVGE